jgi:hypothetical protein
MSTEMTNIEKDILLKMEQVNLSFGVHTSEDWIDPDEPMVFLKATQGPFEPVRLWLEDRKENKITQEMTDKEMNKFLDGILFGRDGVMTFVSSFK